MRDDQLPASVISLDFNRLRIKSDHNEFFYVKKTTIQEYTNLVQMKNLLADNSSLLSVLGTFDLAVPSFFSWDDEKHELTTSKHEGETLETLLCSSSTYKEAALLLNVILGFFLARKVYWLDFAPRNIIIDNAKHSIGLVDFEKGIFGGSKEEYLALIIEEFSVFLLPEDNKYWKCIPEIISSSEILVENSIIKKSNRIRKLHKLFNSTYSNVDLYVALIRAECPIRDNSNLYFPMVYGEAFLSRSDYNGWGIYFANRVDYELAIIKSSNCVQNYNPLGTDSHLCFIDSPRCLLYRNENIRYRIDLAGLSYIPKTGILLCHHLSEILKQNQIKNALDIGTGETAFLARHICACSTETNVDAVDIDSGVVRLLNDNKKAFENRLRFFESNVFHMVEDKQYDLIVSNPPLLPELDSKNNPHDFAGQDGRLVIEQIIKGAESHLTERGVLLLLAFGFIGIDKRTTKSQKTIIELAKDAGLILTGIEHYYIPIRPNGETARCLPKILQLYPEASFSDNKNEVVVIQFRRENIDIGLMRQSRRSSLYDGYIKYCGFFGDHFLFREDYGDGTTNRITISNTGKTSIEPNPVSNVVYQIDSTDNRTHLYLCSTPKSLILESQGGFKTLDLSAFSGTPLFLCEKKEKLIITFHHGGLLCVSRDNLEYICYVDLPKAGYIEPIFVDDVDGCFLVTDSSLHVVRLIDKNTSIIWEYGTAGEPGINENHLCVPVSALYQEGYVVISEQRSHRILKVSISEKKIIRQYGQTDEVGIGHGLLWAPQGTIINRHLYVIMCKAGNICIQRETNEGKLESVYGKPLFDHSILNFPRSCDYSEKLNLLSVCDTYHSRICIFDNVGRLIRTINEINKREIRWPRCAKWIDGNLLIACSVDNMIGCVDIHNTEKWVLDLTPLIGGKEWIQAIDQKKDLLLIAYETFLVVYNLKNKKLVYDSRKDLLFKDLHHAVFYNSGILVADTGNNRIVQIENQTINTYSKIKYGNTDKGFIKPRMICPLKESILVVNSGTSQVYKCDLKLNYIIRIFGGRRGFSDNRLSMPRWVSFGPQGQCYISDTDNHRIALRSID